MMGPDPAEPAAATRSSPSNRSLPLVSSAPRASKHRKRPEFATGDLDAKLPTGYVPIHAPFPALRVPPPQLRSGKGHCRTH